MRVQTGHTPRNQIPLCECSGIVILGLVQVLCVSLIPSVIISSTLYIADGQHSAGRLIYCIHQYAVIKRSQECFTRSKIECFNTGRYTHLLARCRPPPLVLILVF